MEVGPEPNNQVRFLLYHSTCLKFLCVLKPVAENKNIDIPTLNLLPFARVPGGSECGLRTSSTGVTRELVRNAETWAYLRGTKSESAF